MTKRRVAIATIVMLVIGVGGAWALGMFHRVDPKVAELEQMRTQMFANREMPREERRQQFGEFRQRMDSLSEDQRRQVWESGREQFQQFAAQRMDEFFALSREDQQKRLDEISDRMLERRKEREQNAQAGNNRGGNRGQRWQSMTDAQRDAARKQRLDRTTPEMRASFSEFRRMMNERMEARGISPDQVGGFRGGWGRGGA